MKINSVSEITGNASLMLFFATDTGSALTAPVIWDTPTVFFMAKTIRSVTAIHCFIAKQHCFLKLQHCFARNSHLFCRAEVLLPQWGSATRSGDTLLWCKVTLFFHIATLHWRKTILVFQKAMWLCAKTTLLFHEPTLLPDQDTLFRHNAT